jgi:hypothetical protein
MRASIIAVRMIVPLYVTDMMSRRRRQLLMKMMYTMG